MTTPIKNNLDVVDNTPNRTIVFYKRETNWIGQNIYIQSKLNTDEGDEFQFWDGVMRQCNINIFNNIITAVSFLGMH